MKWCFWANKVSWHSITTPEFLWRRFILYILGFHSSTAQSHWWHCKLYSHIRLNLLRFLVPFSNPSCPLRFYQYSGDRASHYAAPTTLALSLLVTDRPAIVPATVQCALTLNSLAGRLPVPASSRNTRRLGSHEGSPESTCHCQQHTTRSPSNPPPEPRLHLLTTLQRNEAKYEIK